MSKFLIDAEPLKSESPQRDFKPNEDSECFLCERGIAEAHAGCWVEMTTSNQLVSSEMPDEERATIDSQGCFPVGKRCARKVPKAFRVKPCLVSDFDLTCVWCANQECDAGDIQASDDGTPECQCCGWTPDKTASEA